MDNQQKETQVIWEKIDASGNADLINQRIQASRVFNQIESELRKQLIQKRPKVIANTEDIDCKSCPKYEKQIHLKIKILEAQKESKQNIDKDITTLESDVLELKNSILDKSQQAKLEQEKIETVQKSIEKIRSETSSQASIKADVYFQENPLCPWITISKDL